MKTSARFCPQRHLLALGFALVNVAVAPRAYAVSAQWTGATDSLWATPTNWSANPVPGTGDTATFNSLGNGNTTLSLGGGITISTIIFDTANAAAYTIGSGAVGSQMLTLNNSGAITMNAAVAQDQTFNAALVLGTDATASTYTLTNSSPSKKLIFAGNISRNGTAGTKTLAVSGTGVGETLISGVIGGGAIAVTKNGGGILTLSGNNTFTGALTVDGGTLAVPVFNNSNADGPLGRSTAAVTLSRYTALRYTGATASSTKRLSIEDGFYATLEIADPAAELTLSGIVDGGKIYKTGSGTLVLAAANTHTGLAVDAGTVRLSGAGTFGASGSDLEVNGRFDLNGKSLTTGYLSGFAAGHIVNNGTGTSTVTMNFTGYSFSGGVLSVQSGPTFAGILADNDNAGAGVVAFTKGGNGDLAFTGANTYSGTTTISGGTISISGNGTLGDSVGGTTVNSGGTLDVSVPSTDEPITISGSGVTLVGYGALTDGALIGGGTLTGLLRLGASATISGTFDIANPGTITGAGSTLTFDAMGNSSIASIIGTTTGGLIKNGTGTLTLTAPNTFTGAVTINAGVLSVPTVNNASTAGPLGNSATAVTLGATLRYTGGTAASTKPFALSTSGTFEIPSAATDLTLSGVISGAGDALVKTGPGTLTLSNATNSYSGGTTISVGTLKLSGTGRPGAITGALTISGGRLDLNATMQTVGSFAGNGVVANNGGGAVTFTIGNGAGTGTFAGTIADNDNATAGTVALTKAGTGTITLAGVNTYSGTTTISGGALRIEHATALGSTTAGTVLTNISNDAALQIQGGIAVGTEPLTIRGTGATAGATGALENVSGTNSFAGLISLAANSTISSTAGILSLTNPGSIDEAFDLTLTGAGDGSLASTIDTGANTVTKTGTGKWTLTGASTYTGTTTISAGILNVQNAGALGSSTSITSGATLQLQGGISTPLAEGLTVRGNGAAGTTGALQNISGFNSWNGIVTLGANSTISSDAGTLFIDSTGNLTGAFDLTLTGAGEGTLRDAIATGANTVTKTGTGTWTLSGGNTFSGALTVADGTLNVPVVNDTSTAGPLGQSALAVTLGAAGGLTGTLHYEGLATETSNKPFVLAAGGIGRISNETSSFPLTLTGLISGSGALEIAGSGTVLTAANTFTGPLTLEGSLTVPTFNNASTNGPLGNSASAVVFASNGRLIYTGATATTNKPLFLEALGQVDVANAASELTLSASISGVANLNAILAKSGPGKLILPVANTYLGATFVYDGTLVAAAAGAISGADVFLQGGTLQLVGAPGINRITDTSDINFQGGTFSMEGLSSATESVDLLRLFADSGIDFGAGTGNSLLFSGISTHTAGTKLAITDWTGIPGVLGTAATDRLIFGGTASAFAASYTQADVLFNGAPGYVALQFGGQYEIVAVPEPAAAGLIVGALLCLGVRRERRRLRS